MFGIDAPSEKKKKQKSQLENESTLSQKKEVTEPSPLPHFLASTLPKSTDTLTRKRREKWETEDRSKSKLEEAQEDSCCGLLPILLCRRKMELLDLLSIVMLLSSLALIVASSAAIFLGVVLLASYLTHHLGFVSLYYVSVPYCIVIVGIVTICKTIYNA